MGKKSHRSLRNVLINSAFHRTLMQSEAAKPIQHGTQIGGEVGIGQDFQRETEGHGTVVPVHTRF